MRRSARHSSDVRLDADLAQLLHRVLGRLGLELAGGRDDGTSVRCTKQALLRPMLEAHLADGLEERQRLDVADRAADLDDRDVDSSPSPTPAPRSMNSLISSVMCGITCTVLPR